MLPSKWENLSRCCTKLIHLCRKLPLALDYRQRILFVNIYIFFNFERVSCGFFSVLFPKAPASWRKKKLKYFLLHCTSICMSSKACLRFFKVFFQTGDINIFVLRGVFFIWYVQLKGSFSDKKAPVKSETYFSREAIEN